MWLLDVRTLKLKEFIGNRIPAYAILSHRWEEEEVSFDDIRAQPQPQTLKGFAKIKAFCAKALTNGLEYGWVDTCCINKNSSSELSEAINSMYRWYETSRTCYVYLSDVETMWNFADSVWLTRGWTLQELLAPRTMVFYNMRWEILGDRFELTEIIENCTSIPEKALQLFVPAQYSIAQKMSWTRNRQTTREEDQAYCLLGLMEVNMPMLYGEGKRAFRRLQDEIMRQNNDLSIFMWKHSPDPTHGMLAGFPQSFATLQGQTFAEEYESHSGTYTPVKGGIEINISRLPFCVAESKDRDGCIEKVFEALLYTEPAGCIRIFVVRSGANSYRRVGLDSLMLSEYRPTCYTLVRRSDVLITNEPLLILACPKCMYPRLNLTIHPFFSQVRTTFRSLQRAVCNSIKVTEMKGDQSPEMSTKTCIWVNDEARVTRIGEISGSRECDCKPFSVQPSEGHLFGAFCTISMTSALPSDISYHVPEDYVRVTFVFGYNDDFELICVAVPFSDHYAHRPSHPIPDLGSCERVFNSLFCSKFASECSADKDSGIVAAPMRAWWSEQDFAGECIGMKAISTRFRRFNCMLDYDFDISFDIYQFFTGQGIPTKPSRTRPLLSVWRMKSREQAKRDFERKLHEIRSTKIRNRGHCLDQYGTLIDSKDVVWGHRKFDLG